jgi:hypothetical protein
MDADEDQQRRGHRNHKERRLGVTSEEQVSTGNLWLTRRKVQNIGASGEHSISYYR